VEGEDTIEVDMPYRKSIGNYLNTYRETTAKFKHSAGMSNNNVKSGSMDEGEWCLKYHTNKTPRAAAQEIVQFERDYIDHSGAVSFEDFLQSKLEYHEAIKGSPSVVEGDTSSCIFREGDALFDSYFQVVEDVLREAEKTKEQDGTSILYGSEYPQHAFEDNCVDAKQISP